MPRRDRMPPEVLADLVDLLAACRAFAGVDRARLQDVARDVEVGYLATVEPPVRPALVVMRGELRVLGEDGAVTDVVDAGEYAAVGPASRVEPVTSALVAWLGDEARSVAWSGARDPAWRAPTQRAVTRLHATPVRAVMSSPVLMVEPSVTCREAAGLMRERRVSSVLVLGRDGPGVLTDRDLRSRLVAEGRPADTVVAEVASYPALVVGADVTCAEAQLEMLAAGVHHLPVVEGERVVGVVTSTDLLALEARSPLAVRSAVDRAGSVEGVAAAVAELPGSVARMLGDGADPHEVGRVVATVTDRVQRTLLGLAFAELGRPEGEFAWVCFGSQARREQTLLTDQDTGLVLPTGADDEAWAAVAAWVTDALEQVGYPRCRGGVMASESLWRHDLAGWHARLDGLVRQPTEHHLLESAIVFDARVVTGSVTVADLLGPSLVETVRDATFRGRLARVATMHRPPLGFLGRLTVEHHGEHRGQLDLKKGALLPVADLARLTAVARGGPEVGTDERLEAAAETGAMSRDLSGTLRAGYALALGLRLQRHVELFEAGETLSNHLDPGALDPWVRAELKEYFKAIRVAQEHVSSTYLVGMLG
ncbi:MAG: DUF294 nucleotidyltransferase-like domain-containing protein [Actinomycetota bacterium]|nr:DUF294 nucleotidyltransferase-like domain-containing protein [Actinomycetota bacterium]